MDVREKLVKLLENHCAVIGEDNCKASQSGKCTPRDCAICLASDLISNGVTVQEERRWIPVTDSPKGKGCYIVVVNHWVNGKPVVREAYWNGCDWLSCDKNWELTPRVTHWIPMPQPPKEE